MSQLNAINQSASANQIDTNPFATGNFYVPCVPIAVSANLVAVQPVAKRLAASASELAHLSLADFVDIQLKKSELRLTVDECALTDEALLDVCMLNVRDLFANLAAFLIAQGQVAENSPNDNLQINLQVSLQQVHAYAAAMGVVAAEYCIEGVIHPEMLFEACLKRLQVLQKRWQDNHFQSIELALQLQRDAVYAAAANCLMEICQDGLDNQIALEPTPQVQEDVLVALATFVDLPFSGEWPVLRERVIVLGNEGGVQ
jgi:hypothetical protein